MRRGMRQGRGFLVRAEAAQKAEILIYDMIGRDWFGEGVAALDVIEALSELAEGTEVTVRLNTPGGSVTEGVAIYNALARFPGRVVTRIEAAALSIGSLIAQAGHEREMADNAVMMVHSPWTFTMGNSEELRKEAEVLDTFEGAMLATYAKRTGKAEEEIRSLLRAETWMDAAAAKELGFVDSIGESRATEAQARFDLSRFKGCPPELRAKLEAPPKEEPQAAGAEGLNLELARARLRRQRAA